jgi:hypothetical protein
MISATESIDASNKVAALVAFEEDFRLSPVMFVVNLRSPGF